MDDKVFDVDYTEVDPREFFTVEEAAEKLKVEVGELVFWCNKFEDILKINSIGQFKIFSREDIRNLITIKELNKDKGMSINEVKAYFKQNSTAIVVKKNNEINTAVLNFFSNIFNTQNQKIDKLIETQNQSMQMFSKLYEEISVDSDAKSNLLNKIIEEQNEQKQYTEKVENKIDNFLNAMEDTQRERDMEMMDFLKRNMEERFKLSQQEKKKGWLDKFLGK